MANAIPNTQNISKILIDAVANEPNPLFDKDVNGVVLPQVINNITCHENEPTILIDNSKIFDKKPRQESNRQKALKSLTPYFYEENVSDECIKKAMQICGAAVSNIQCKFEDGTVRYFTSNTKGTKRYNLRKKFEIKDEISHYNNSNWETFGLTLTCNPTVYGNLPYVSWKHFKDDYKPLFKYIREKLHGIYIMVMESTKKGYPHAHLFVAFPKGTIPNYKTLPVRKTLKYGFLANQIKKRIKHPIFNLQKVAGKHLENYMSKYIGKMSDVNIFAVTKKKEELNEQEKKVCLCHIYTTITETRQFVLPIHRKNKNNSQDNNALNGKETNLNTDATTQEESPQQLENSLCDENISSKSFAGLPAYLIGLCTNSPCYFKNDVRIMSQRRFEELFDVPIEEMQKQNDEVHERFKLHSSCLTCGGCFNSHLARFLVNGNDEWFDNALWFENGTCELAFSDEVKKDKELFGHRLAWWTEYALCHLRLAGCKISQFFKDPDRQKLVYVKSRIVNSYLSEKIKMLYLHIEDYKLLQIGEQKGWI